MLDCHFVAVTGKSGLGVGVAVHLGVVHIREERMRPLLGVGEGFAGDVDDAGRCTRLGFVGRCDLGTELCRFEVGDLHGPQLGDALIEGIGTGLKVGQVLVFDLGEVAGFVCGTGQDAVDGFGKFCPFFNELVKQTHFCAFHDRVGCRVLVGCP